MHYKKIRELAAIEAMGALLTDGGEYEFDEIIEISFEYGHALSRRLHEQNNKDEQERSRRLEQVYKQNNARNVATK